MEIYNETYCVYVHTNRINGKKYVGQTVYGDNPQKRWKNGNGYRGDTHFWHAIQKYGWENFEHEIIASNLTSDEADNFEKLLISKLDLRNPDKGYNLESGGKRNKTIAESTKKKISKSHVGVLAGDKNPMYGVSPRERMDEDTYNSWLKQTNDRVSSEEFKEKMRKINIGKKYSDETNAKKGHKGEKHPMAKAVDQYSRDGGFIKRWDYAKLAAGTLGVSLSNIIACCRGTKGRKTAGGFIWKYASIEKGDSLCVL